MSFNHLLRIGLPKKFSNWILIYSKNKEYFWPLILSKQSFKNSYLLLMCYKQPLSAILAVLFLFSINFSSAQMCATPGKDGGGNISGIVNTYFPGTASIASGSTTVSIGAGLGASTPIAKGDLLVFIQVQGADVTGLNTDVYGDNVSSTPANGYLNNSNLTAGLYEYAIAANSVLIGGGSLTLQKPIVHSYVNRDNADGASQGQARFQIIRIPQYSSVTLSANLSPLLWNGSTGGVIALDVAGVLDFNGFNIDASTSGFRGGGGRQLGGGGVTTGSDYVSPASVLIHGSKAEGFAGTPKFINNNGTLLDNTLEGYPNGSMARGAPGNAGGGGTDSDPYGNSENSGGGGGSNGGVGGQGGNAWNTAAIVGGYPGAAFTEVATSRLVLGGGGGAGSTNNGTGAPGNGFASSGATGGGAVMLRAGSVIGSGSINVNGGDANNTVLNDGSGGGGAGGSVILLAGNTSGLVNITILANGGTGGTNTGGGVPHGPGGGGGGGVIYANGTLNAASSVTGGANGVTSSSLAFGSTPGNPGILLQNISAPANDIAGFNCIAPPTANNIVAHAENNSYGQTVIPALSASDPYVAIANYTIQTIPLVSQGILYLCNPSCNAVTAGQVILPADIASLKFDPSATFTGTASFTYSATNTTNIASNTAIYSIPVGNEQPIADNILTQPIFNTGGIQPMPAFAAADPDGSIVSYAVITIPNAVTEGALSYCSDGTVPCTGIQTAISGPLTLTPAQAATLSFTPVATFTGYVSFNYTAADNSGSVSPAATYTIPVRGGVNIHMPPYSDNIVAPQVTNDASATLIPEFSGHAPTGTIASYTLETIPSAAQGSLTYCSNGTEPCTGSVTPVTAGVSLSAAQMATLKFTANIAFSGKASFSYSSTDNTGVKSNIADYTIPVVNLTPVANPITTVPMTNTFGATAIPSLIGHATSNITGYTITTIPAGASGVLSLCNPGCNPVIPGQTIALADISKLTFDPTAGFTGNAFFNYTATDNTGDISQPAVYTIPVTATSFSSNVPPIAANISAASISNTSGQTAIPSLAANDADGFISSYTINSIPAAAYGILYLCNPGCNPVTAGQAILQADAANLKFAPAAGYNGNVIFNYTATDNSGSISNVATYSIPVKGLSPKASNVTSSPLSVTSGQSPLPGLSALENGGTIATYTIDNLPSVASGVLYLCTPGCVAVTPGQVLTAADISNLSFTPSPTFNGIYTQFNYTATDANGVLSNIATFTIPLTINATLPLHLISFGVEKRVADVKLNWATENEINSKFFTVERSLNGLDFTAIGRVNAAGNVGTGAYKFVDNTQNLNSGMVYYRLKIVDADGQFKYSPVVAVKLDGKVTKNVVVTPNPVRTAMQLNISSDVNATANLKITTILGQLLYQSKQVVYKGANIISMQNISSKLSNGTYVLRTVIDGETFTTKFILQR
jgi:hypothetical protein